MKLAREAGFFTPALVVLTGMGSPFSKACRQPFGGGHGTPSMFKVFASYPPLRVLSASSSAFVRLIMVVRFWVLSAGGGGLGRKVRKGSPSIPLPLPSKKEKWVDEWRTP